MGINNVSNQPQELGSNNLSLQNNSKRYFVNQSRVDKTPQSDTVQLSNKQDVAKKVGIGVAIVGTAVGIFYLLRGKKPPKAVTNGVQEAAEHSAGVAHTTPKMEITEEAKKAYDDAAKKFHKKTQVTSETIEHNLKPKEKAGSWSSDDMKEYYTKLEKESDAKLAAEKATKEAEAKAAKEAEAKAAKEAEAKAAKEAEAKAAKEAEEKALIDLDIQDLKKNVSSMSPRELYDLKDQLSTNVFEMHCKARQKANEYELRGFYGRNTNIIDYENYMSSEDRIKYRDLTNKLEIITKQIKANDEKLKAFLPTICEGSNVPMHYYLNGVNMDVRRAVKYEHTPLPDDLDKEFYEKSIARGKEIIKKTDAQFENLPETEKEYIVYRGHAESSALMQEANEDFAIVEKAQKGDIIIPDKGYSYTAFHRDLAEHFGGNKVKDNGRAIIYTIHIPKGAKVSRMMANHDGEVVMPRGAEYKVLSKKVHDSGYTEIELEYIIPSKK